jgi:hypothetical protein
MSPDAVPSGVMSKNDLIMYQAKRMVLSPARDQRESIDMDIPSQKYLDNYKEAKNIYSKKKTRQESITAISKSAFYKQNYNSATSDEYDSVL